MRVIVSGGGSGGHVFPAIAVADELRELLPDIEILFIGAEGKIEMDKVPKAGYPIQGLPIRGLQRRFTAANLAFPVRLIESLVKARSIIKDFKPDVAAGFGGYASGPTLYVSARMGVPTLIQEQNSYPGMTNKLLAPRAKSICVAYSEMQKFFPAEKIRLTGNPVRKDLRKLDGKREEACRHFGLKTDKKTLLVFGGSLGARTLNEAMRSSEELLSKRDDIQVLWQLGKLYAEQYESCATAKLGNISATMFIDRMDLAYALADLVICRAGALTISELSLASKPAILVPSPNVAEDHQSMNAVALVKKGAAEMIEDSNAVRDVISKAVEVVRDYERLNSLSRAISELAMPNAAHDIAQEVIEVAKL